MITKIKKILKQNKYIKKLYIYIFGYKVKKFFDSSWYLKTYPDVKKENLDPLLHYLRHGKKEKRYISENDFIINNIDSNWYVMRYPDAYSSDITPLQHYLTI